MYVDLSIGIGEMYLVCLGLCLGSFIGCAVSRKERIQTEGLQKAMSGRSHCDSCGKELKWYELIPVLSWCVQGGKCRGCGVRVPVWCMGAEIGAAVTALMFSWMDWKYACVLVGMYVCGVFDAQYGEVPRWATDVTLAVAGGLALWSLGWRGITAGALVFVMFWVIYQVRPGSVGGADVKLLSAACMFYPMQYVAVCLGLTAGVGLVCLWLTKEKGLRLVPVLWVVYLCMYWISL